ncbi:MAG: alpha/beta fold hydrolase, partial [Bacteroidia bacterium]
VIGGSQGGQIAQEWALHQPAVFGNLILIATNAQHSPWGIAFNESQRLAIKADRTYFSNSRDGGQKGLQAARSIALLSYRNHNTYNATQSEAGHQKLNNYSAASYQRYQGEKLVKRFNAYSYVRLSEAMDSHNVARSRHEQVESALKLIKARTLVISVSSDFLFPKQEQEFLATHISGAVYKEIDSFYGHDGFLIETQQLSEHLALFLVNGAASAEKIYDLKSKI